LLNQTVDMVSGVSNEEPPTDSLTPETIWFYSEKP